MNAIKELQAEKVTNWFVRHIDQVEFINSDNSKEICDLLTRYPYAKSIDENLTISLNLWKQLIDDALTNIGNKDRNSINALKKYIDSFSKFEGILYGIDPRYKDHIIHTIWVFLIGYYLVKRQGTFDMIRTNIPQEKLEAAWCVIALSHDLGYPFSKIENINQSVNEMIKKLNGIKLKPLTLERTDEYQKIKDDVLLLLSSEYIVEEEKDYRKDKENQIYFLSQNEKLRIKYEKSINASDHGIMSCMVLLDYFPLFSEVLPIKIGERNIPYKLKVEYDTRASILQIIANHTCKDVKIIGKNRFSIFLMICDEIAELYRPTRWNNMREMITNICRVRIDKFGIDEKEITLLFNHWVVDDEIRYHFEAVKNKFEGATIISSKTPSKTSYGMNFKNHKRKVIGYFKYDPHGRFTCSSF